TQRRTPVRNPHRLSCILAILVSAAFAQDTPSEPRYRIETLGGTPQQCQYAVRPLLHELEELQYPSGWTFVLVCTEIEWGSLTRKVEPLRGTDSAATFLPKRTTILRGEIFKRRIERGYAHTLRHELGHILCNCMSEVLAENMGFHLR